MAILKFAGGGGGGGGFFGGGGFGSGGTGSGGSSDGGGFGGLSDFEIARMSPEELADYFGRGVEGFDTEEFLKRFGSFMRPFDETRINLLEEGFQIGGDILGSQFNRARGSIRSNMALSAGVEKERGLVLADYAGRMRNLGLGLSQDVLGEYERYASDTFDFFRQLAEREVFTKDYWSQVRVENKADEIFSEGGSFGGLGSFFGFD